jgi:hypothetical protein
MPRFYIRDVCAVKPNTVSQLVLRQEQFYSAISYSIAEGDKKGIVSVLFDFAHGTLGVCRSVYGACWWLGRS